MAWVKLDDGFPEHPKVQQVGGDAAWLHVCALAYCNRNLTDGFIAAQVVGRLSDRRAPRKLVERLVEAGLWHVENDGWAIHDFLAFQPSKAKVEAERAAARERMAAVRGSKSSAELPTNFAGSSRNPDPTRPDPSVSTSTQHQPSTDCPEGVDNSSVDRMGAAADEYARLALEGALSAGRKISSNTGYVRGAKRKALANPELASLLAMFPTAPAGVIAACLLGDKPGLAYYPRADELAEVTPIRPERTA